MEIRGKLKKKQADVIANAMETNKHTSREKKNLMLVHYRIKNNDIGTVYHIPNSKEHIYIFR